MVKNKNTLYIMNYTLGFVFILSAGVCVWGGGDFGGDKAHRSASGSAPVHIISHESYII